MTIYFSPSSQAFYDNEIVPTIPTDAVQITQQTHMQLLYELNHNHKDITYVDGEFGTVDRPIIPITWDTIRAKRDRYLQRSDWTQLPDIPKALRDKWAVYRQALRDITNADDPASVVWPKAPE